MTTTVAVDVLPTEGPAREYAALGLWRDHVLTDYLDQATVATPDRIASVDSRGTLTYRELRDQVDRVALGYLGLGIRPGDTIAIQLPNWREWIVAHYAAIRIGAITTPLIPIYREREIGYMLQTARAKLLVTVNSFRGFDYPAMIERLRPALPQLQHVLVVDHPATPREGCSSWEEFLATPWEALRDRALLPALRPDPRTIALIIFTSGTTGRPKGVVHSHNTLVAASMPWPDRLGHGEDAVVHMASTFGHLTGYLYGVSLPVLLGGTGIFQDVWNNETFLELVERWRINHTSGATPFLHDLLQAPSLHQRDLSSLRYFCCMGAPIPRVLVEHALTELPTLSVFGGWGQTECGLVTMGHPSNPVEKIVNSDGRALRGMSIRVVDAAGQELPAGLEGRLQVQGPFLFHGYLGQEDVTRHSFDGPWFDTGDLATIDEEGYLRIQGRTKDVIIRGGENVPVAYVENVLYEHPDISDAALIGVPHPRLQETAVAVVVLNDPASTFTIEDLREFFAGKGVAKPYWPEHVRVLPELPRTPSGKIQKYRLRELIADEQDAADAAHHRGARP